MFDLIIVANGKSLRFGENKMLIKINDQYLINKTVSQFIDNKMLNKIIVVSDIGMSEYIDKKYLDKIDFVNGGSTRSLSVQKGLEVVESEYVLIHDGARPFTSKQLIAKIVDNLKDNQVVIPILKVSNCLKYVNGEIKTVNRDDYVMSQTPQGFRSEIIKKAYSNVDPNWIDDCQAVENKNIEIKFIEGEIKNIKITYKEDTKI
ncbi:IspD/TarI family cytidylyltransferase [Spiroplasma culicicola]|uniref:2-C-methyl-D-erythritol 4-phosphate cytidylyltransferase n=1 Tax=Spiroplasma culicicola AES-1 TaxID=1276246 RepID=W6A5U4_9MOLU|nr:IspD/TarI family cytidylyltransferase [Spiroplasma culicicola]AHI52362.1 2-C-methyl-D-erythritol 4-phosphate cytidylyltransferase [Spiroplasma culicicola AES-1]